MACNPRPLGPTLVLLPDRNSAGTRDYERSFDPYSRAFALHAGAVRLELDCSAHKPARLRQAIAAIEAHRPHVIAWIGHGLMRSLPQLGLATPSAIAAFTAAIAAASAAPIVILYACSAASGPGAAGDGGLAELLRDALVEHGADAATVVGHATAGDPLRNPYARRFIGPTHKPVRAGGEWFVEPRSKLWGRWCAALRRSTLPYYFPMMTPAEVAATLEVV